MAVHLGFPKNAEKIDLSLVPLGKIGGDPLWLGEDLEVKCCEIPSMFICQLLAPGEEDFCYYRYLYAFQCPVCLLPSVYRGQLPKSNQLIQEETKSEALDDWNVEASTENIMDLLSTPVAPANYSDITFDIYQEDYKVTEIARKLFYMDVKNEASVNDIYELIEGGNESFNEEKISQDESDDIDDDIVEDKTDRDVSFDAFKWFSNFTLKSPCVRYGRDSVPFWYSDAHRPVLANTLCSCGLVRTFECQILPQIISYVRAYDLDFGTILIYTCPRSCVSGLYVKEQAYYQPSM